LEKAFELYAMVQNYDAMKNIADKMYPSPELESKKIYLKLKEYQKL